MGLEKFIEKRRKYKTITFSNRFRSYVQDHINNQQRIRNFANAFPQQHKSREFVDEKENVSHPLWGMDTKQVEHITDAEGLDRAREQEKRIYVHGNTLYVSGTAWRNKKTGMPSLQDPWDDLKIPIYKTRYAQRYKDADEFMKQNPNIDRVVGHSLGGSVALELATNYNVVAQTYKAPVVETRLFSNGVPTRKIQTQKRPSLSV